MARELDLVKFNRDFEKIDKSLDVFKPSSNIRNKTKYVNEETKYDIDETILKMRLAFDILLDRIIKKQNPINEILSNNKLMEGTIILLFFIGGLTLMLSGLMHD